MPLEIFSPPLAVALAVYAIGVASPGPSNMAIMATAMSQGRPHAMAMALGVVCGSLLWGLAAAFGLSTILQTYSWTLILLKILGGLYMLLLSWKAARAALQVQVVNLPARFGGASKRGCFARGMGMHLTNPKAVFVWLSIVALALPPGASQRQAFGVVACCAVIGLSVFFGYALAFSTALARRIYVKAHRWLNVMLSAVFAFAGFRLLLSRTAA
jgi:threonine/homoserine/homoserine lactone efflux protein